MSNQYITINELSFVFNVDRDFFTRNVRNLPPEAVSFVNGKMKFNREFFREAQALSPEERIKLPWWPKSRTATQEMKKQQKALELAEKELKESWDWLLDEHDFTNTILELAARPNYQTILIQSLLNSTSPLLHNIIERTSREYGLETRLNPGMFRNFSLLTSAPLYTCPAALMILDWRLDIRRTQEMIDRRNRPHFPFDPLILAKDLFQFNSWINDLNLGVREASLSISKAAMVADPTDERAVRIYGSNRSETKALQTPIYNALFNVFLWQGQQEKIRSVFRKVFPNISDVLELNKEPNNV